MPIGHLLKRTREKKRLSQQEVANFLNIAQKTLSNIESNKSNPTIEQLSRLSELYDVDMIELLSQNGITFNQHNQKRENDGVVHQHQFLELPKLQYESRIKDKEDIISLLKEEVKRLKGALLI